MRPIALLLLTALAAGVSFAAPTPTAPACFDDWWKARIAVAAAVAGDPSALLPLRQAATMTRTAADPDDLWKALEAFRARRDVHPLVAAELDTLLLYQDIARGRQDGARERAGRLGLVTSYRIAGPLKEGRPADGFYADASAWRVVDTPPSGLLVLTQIVTPAARTNAAAVFYVSVARPVQVALRYGADDRARLEIDGQTVLDPPGRHDLGFDQHAAFVELTPGVHRVALWVEQEADQWALTLRLTAPDGRPLEPGALSVSAPDAADDVARLEAQVPTARPRSIEGTTITALLERRAGGRDARARALLADDLAARDLPERGSARAVLLAREAAAALRDDPDALWVQAVVDTDQARAREALEAIVARDATHPGALRRLAGYHLEHGRMNDSISLARRSITACGRPDPYLEGWEALARDYRGFPAGALSVLDALVARYPNQTALLERCAELASRDGLKQRARRVYEQLLERDRQNDRARDGAIGLAIETGDGAAARRLAEEAVAIDPLDIRWQHRLAELHLAQGRVEEAAETIRRALTRAPGNPPLLEAWGEVQLAGGDASGAVATWRRALAVAQDRGSLTDRISAVTGADDAFGAEWTVSLDKAREIERTVPVEGDPAALVLSKTAAYRVRPDGLSSRFQQTVIRVRRPDEAGFARSLAFSYSPSLERQAVIAARLVRRDGTVVLAERSDRPLLPDPEIRMWYDTRIVQLTFPRLEEGDLIDARWRVEDLGSANAIGESYFGDVWPVGEEVPVLDARIVIESPQDVQWRLVHLPSDPQVSSADRDGRRLTIVTLPRLPGYATAQLSPPSSAYVPYAVLGTTANWEELGRTYARLVRDQAVAGPDLEAIVRSVTARARDRAQIVRGLYEWVIENTRYVALELGIHALKPYDVPSVLKRRFGDCKDKATLLATMLREAGIEAHVALVRTRDRGPIDTAVPTLAHFDHAIVHVPSSVTGTELWLDGTVTDHAMGEVPSADRNALALIIDEKSGGRLVTIPEMTPDDAFAASEQTIEVDSTGAAGVTVRIAARGDDAARERMYFRAADRKAVVLANRLRRALPDISMKDADFDAVGLSQPEVRYSYRARLDRFGRAEGDALSLPLGLDVPSLPVSRPSAGRTLPVELPPPFRRRMVSKVVYPPGFAVRELPHSETLASRWGTLSIEVTDRGRAVEIVVDLAFRGGTVPVDALADFGAFVEQVTHATSSRIVVRPR